MMNKVIEKAVELYKNFFDSSHIETPYNREKNWIDFRKWQTAHNALSEAEQKEARLYYSEYWGSFV